MKTNKSEIRINEERTMNNGQKAIIINYRGIKDIDVQFEDNTIVYHKIYNNFKNGRIKNPNIKTNHNRNKSKIRINEERTMNNGQKATIIDYRGTKDIDVRFEDNTIVSHKTYRCFRKGEIRNPNFNRNKINQVMTMNNGQKATIINYRDAKDIDIQFEDGTIIYHKTYNSFKNGGIKNPNIRINETRTMNNGQKATIIGYKGAKDIDIQFEDGTIVQHREYSSFKKGAIKNPNIC